MSKELISDGNSFVVEWFDRAYGGARRNVLKIEGSDGSVVLGNLTVDKTGAVTIAAPALANLSGNLSFAKEAAHTINIAASTTTNASGGALSIEAGAKNGSGTNGVINIGVANTSAVNISPSTGKVGFFAVTAVVQPQSTGQTAGQVAGSGTGVKVDDTFTGGVGSTAYTIGDILKALKQLGLMKA